MAQHVDQEDTQLVKTASVAKWHSAAPTVTLLNESGLYSLIMGSKLEGAKTFN